MRRSAAVVDTMVFAYCLLGVVPHHEASASVLEALGEVWVPDSVRSELANVMWQWCRAGRVALDLATLALDDADALIDYAVPANELWHRALELAVEHNHPAYDTLFIALAEARNLSLLTYDNKLIAKFPGVAVTPEAFLAVPRV